MVREVASRQHGAVARPQLLARGVTREAIARRIERGMLLRVHSGVYLSAPALDPLGQAAAALLACGRGSLLSHVTAASLLALPAPADDCLHVTVVGRWRRPPKGVQVHTIGWLPRVELRRHHGLAITSPSLTLLDLAGTLNRRELITALNEGRVQGLVNDARLHATLAAHPQRKGARALRQLIDTEKGPRITRSEAERKALRVMTSYGIEPDASDLEIGSYRLDFYFERERLAVEVDGYRYHGTPKRFVDDRHRTTYLAARGIQVFPLTWHDLGRGAPKAMRRLARTLAERRAIR